MLPIRDSICFTAQGGLKPLPCGWSWLWLSMATALRSCYTRLDDDGQNVTFRYTDSKAGKEALRTLGER